MTTVSAVNGTGATSTVTDDHVASPFPPPALIPAASGKPFLMETGKPVVHILVSDDARLLGVINIIEAPKNPAKENLYKVTQVESHSPYANHSLLLAQANDSRYTINWDFLIFKARHQT